MAEGWVKVHRRITEWQWYKDGPAFKLFMHLILIANREPKSWKGIKVKPGQIVTGRHSLAKDTGLTEQQVRTAIDKLVSTNEITISSTNRSSLISIVNWSLYQIINQDINQPETNIRKSKRNQPAINQQKNDTNDYESDGCGDEDESINQQSTSNQPATQPAINQQLNQQKKGTNECESDECVDDYESINQQHTGKSTNKSSENNHYLRREKKEVVGNNEPFFEFFRRVAGPHITDDELMHEIAKFKNKYPNMHPNRAGALINTWVANIGKVENQTLTQKPRIVV